MTATTRPPVMGLAEAAKACGVSVSTVRRKRDELREHGAAETASGWQIPVTALIAVGLMTRTTEAPAAATPDDALKGELDALRLQLAEAQLRAAVAEERAAGAQALVAAHERIIETQAIALRMLEKGSSTAEQASPLESPAEGQLRPPAPQSAPTPDIGEEGPTPQGGPLWRRLARRRPPWK